MGNQMKFKKRVSGYFEAPMRLGFFLLLINILILFMHWPSGLVLLVFTICYFVVVIALRMHSRALVINEMVSFATEYGQVQKRLLKNRTVCRRTVTTQRKIRFCRTCHPTNGKRPKMCGKRSLTLISMLCFLATI